MDCFFLVLNRFARVLLLSFIIVSCNPTREKEIERTVRTLRVNDIGLNSPQPGEWLYEHKEKGQSFEEYIKSSPLQPSSTRNVIYLQPVGEFDSVRREIIRYTADYLHAFFGLEVVIAETIPNKVFPDSVRRIGREGNEQILASYVLNEVLMKRIPDDAIAYMALTEKDLYPKPSWNFVFGLASYRNRVGVTSVYRFANYHLESGNYNRCLSRLIKIASHELGHMFSMKHCTYAVCAMNGTNSVMETDSKPNRLCSECTGKLLWNLKMDKLFRLKQLQNFFTRHNLKEDYDLLTADIELLK